MRLLSFGDFNTRQTLFPPPLSIRLCLEINWQKISSQSNQDHKFYNRLIVHTSGTETLHLISKSEVQLIQLKIDKIHWANASWILLYHYDVSIWASLLTILIHMPYHPKFALCFWNYFTVESSISSSPCLLLISITFAFELEDGHSLPFCSAYGFYKLYWENLWYLPSTTNRSMTLNKLPMVTETRLLALTPV